MKSFAQSVVESTKVQFPKTPQSIVLSDSDMATIAKKILFLLYEIIWGNIKALKPAGVIVKFVSYRSRANFA